MDSNFKNIFVIDNEMFIIEILDTNIWQLTMKRGDKVYFDREVTKSKGVQELRKWTKRKIDRLCEHG